MGFVLVLYTMAGWWRDVVHEFVVEHDHTPVVKLGLRFGMVLFIASEVMFFVAWFWAYFNSGCSRTTSRSGNGRRTASSPWIPGTSRC